MSDKIIIVDDFYENPHAVRELAMRSRYANIEDTDYPGFASQLVLSNPALRTRFEAMIGAEIIVDDARFTWGGFRFVTSDSGSRTIVHADAAIDWAAMIYLTPGAPDYAGTGFYRHRPTGLAGPPSDREARALGYADAAEFDDRVIRPDKADPSKWELIEQVAPRFNRLVLFQGGQMYHAPMGGCGADQNDARLTHIFFFNAVAWARPVVQGSRFGSLSATGTVIDCRDIPNPLIAAVKGACGLANNSANYVLVPWDANAIAVNGLAGMAHAAVAAGETCQTAAGLAALGHGLDIIVLVELDGEGAAVGQWTINGWCLLREHGVGLDLRGARLRGAQLQGTKLKGANLAGADLRGADLEKASLARANLTGALLAGANLFSATLSEADLREADLSRVDLRHADLRRALCARTVFRGADLWNAYTWNTDLSEAFTEGADFSRADNLTGVLKKTANRPSPQELRGSA